MIRVVVADDQSVVRTALAALVSTAEDIEVVGQAAHGRDAVSLATRYRPDVVLMDLRMPVLDGIEATRQIRATLPGTSVLVLTTYDLDEYVFSAIRAGASGFLLKDGDVDDLVGAIRRCARGESVMDPGALRRLLDEFVRWIFPSLVAHRRPKYEAMAKRYGHTLNARLAESIKNERDFLELVANALG